MLAQKEKRASVLIYLTKDHGCPRDEIENSRSEFVEKRPDATEPFSCHWLSWRHLAAVTDTSGHPIMGDLGQLLCRLDLTPFTGISRIANRPTYRLRAPQPTFDWQVESSPRWRFMES